MKIIKYFFFVIFMLNTFFYFTTYNLLYTIYMYSLLFIPILFVILLNFNRRDCKIDNLNYMLNTTIDIYFVCLVLSFVFEFFNSSIYNKNVNLQFFLVFYFFTIINFVIYINYYSILNIKNRYNLKVFFASIYYVLRKNFIMNLICIFIFIFLKKYTELLIGVVGSYIFFLITEVNSNYIDKKENNSCNSIQKVLQVILNFSSLWVLAYFERIFFSIINNQNIDFNIYYSISLILLILSICINFNISKIEKFIKKKMSM